jgi:EAL domain-containing protein (putative c-di-GMP-specific phosphodiesterase class I)
LQRSGKPVPTVCALTIDQSFVRDIGKDNNNTALITAIIAMTASLQLEVSTEGVETLQQAQFLVAHGCDEAPGFYLSEAVSGDGFLELFGMLWGIPDDPDQRGNRSL